MPTDQFIHANGGVGETSYSKNSSYQSKIMSKVKPILEEGIKRLYCSSSVPSSCLKVGDLGCSSGPNALQVASHIIDIVDAITTTTTTFDPPIFQFFLNDQFRNDFNYIFELLPDFYERLQQEKGGRIGACFVNATPGSFYGRLFPDSSIHLFHSSTSLHWLSQAPKGLAQGTGLVNKGNIYITSTSPPAVRQAYLEQFQHDFNLFLRSRAEELVQGGAMFLSLTGRDKARDRELITPWGLIGAALDDMVPEGLVEEAKLDSFNMPRYGPSAEEVREVVEAQGSFAVQTLETINSRWDEGLNKDGNHVSDTYVRADFVAKYVRATHEPLLKAEFGEGVIDQVFLRFRNIVRKLLDQGEELEHANVVMFMIKK